VSSSGASFDIGNWHIDLEVVSNVSVDGNQCPLEGPAITVWNVLENDISYHIPYKDGTNSYVIDPEIRFPPTQNLDTAGRDALPLVVPSALSFAHLPKEDRPPRKANRWDRAMMELPTCVKVTLKFRRTKLYVVSNDDDDAS
jgi:hypothetical protein